MGRSQGAGCKDVPELAGAVLGLLEWPEHDRCLGLRADIR